MYVVILASDWATTVGKLIRRNNDVFRVSHCQDYDGDRLYVFSHE